MTSILYPLQTTVYFQEGSRESAIYFGIVAGILLLIFLIYKLIRRRVVSSAVGKGKGKIISARKFSGLVLHRIASAYDLDHEQTKLLEFVFRNDGVSDPQRVMANPILLDKHFKRAYKTIEKNADNEEEAQQRLNRLFNLRNVIESNPNVSAVPTSHQLPENMAAVLSNGKESYPVKIMSSKGDSVIVDSPRNVLGTPIKMANGTKVSLSFFTKTSQGFSFESKVLDTTSTAQGPTIQIAHARKVKPLSQRKYRRKESSINCAFNFVFVEEQKGRKPPKLIVEARRFIGTILDISLGGCSMKSTAAIQVGSRLKIDIDYSDELVIPCLGQVLRSNRSGLSSTIFHIKFLKVPRTAINAINALVFGYSE
ncbi:flagellar brake protein [Breznakiellaceae bacterium SP9]